MTHLVLLLERMQFEATGVHEAQNSSLGNCLRGMRYSNLMLLDQQDCLPSSMQTPYTHSTLKMARATAV